MNGFQCRRPHARTTSRRGVLGMELLGELLTIVAVVGGIVVAVVVSGLSDPLVETGRADSSASKQAGSFREPVYRMQLSADGRTLASYSRCSNIVLHDVATGREVARLRLFAEQPASIALAPEQDQLLAGYMRGRVVLWCNIRADYDYRSMQEGHSDSIREAAFSPDGRLAATSGSDGDIRIWDTVAGDEYRRCASNGGGVHAVRFSPDGRLIVYYGSDQSIRVWNVEDAEEIRRFDGHSDLVSQIRFTPDGRRLVSVGFDGTVRQWCLDEGRELWRSRLEAYGIRSVGISHDGRLIAAAGFDKQISFLDADSGELKVQFAGHDGGVTGLEFLPGDRTLISAGYDGTIRYWDVATAAETRRLTIE
jgi:WD40 repeat protein